MKTLIKALLLATLLLPSTALAITYRSDVSDSKILDWGTKHQCVLRIQGKGCTTSFMCSGSCVVIDPHIVITAAHVMDDMDGAYVIDNEGKHHDIEAAVVPDGWSINKYGIKDISIAYVKDPIKLEFYPGLYTEEDEVGKVCSIAGWGRHGTLQNGYGTVRHKEWKRRAGSNIVDKYDRDLLSISPTKKHSKADRLTTLEAIISPGDSGGGMFIDGKVAGIHSVLITDHHGMPLNGKYHCYSGSTRISKYHKWITSNAEKLKNFYRLTEEVNKALGVK